MRWWIWYILGLKLELLTNPRNIRSATCSPLREITSRSDGSVLALSDYRNVKFLDRDGNVLKSIAVNHDTSHEKDYLYDLYELVKTPRILMWSYSGEILFCEPAKLEVVKRYNLTAIYQGIKGTKILQRAVFYCLSKDENMLCVVSDKNTLFIYDITSSKWRTMDIDHAPLCIDYSFNDKEFKIGCNKGYIASYNPDENKLSYQRKYDDDIFAISYTYGAAVLRNGNAYVIQDLKEPLKKYLVPAVIEECVCKFGKDGFIALHDSKRNAIHIINTVGRLNSYEILCGYRPYSLAFHANGHQLLTSSASQLQWWRID